VPGSDTLQVVPAEFQVGADCTFEMVASAGTAASKTTHKRDFFITHSAKFPRSIWRLAGRSATTGVKVVRRGGAVKLRGSISRKRRMSGDARAGKHSKARE